MGLGFWTFHLQENGSSLGRNSFDVSTYRGFLFNALLFLFENKRLNVDVIVRVAIFIRVLRYIQSLLLKHQQLFVLFMSNQGLFPLVDFGDRGRSEIRAALFRRLLVLVGLFAGAERTDFPLHLARHVVFYSRKVVQLAALVVVFRGNLQVLANVRIRQVPTGGVVGHLGRGNVSGCYRRIKHFIIYR